MSKKSTKAKKAKKSDETQHVDGQTRRRPR